MISIYCGKVEDLLINFRSDFFDACLCDPPYGLKFMGKSWDHGVPSTAIWGQVRRTLKPGAPILAFGGTRTYHRLAVAIEDAGFEIFDSVLGGVWIYGQGFPKSLNIGKEIDRIAGAKREAKPRTRVDGKATGQDGGWKNSGSNVSIDYPDAVTEDAKRWNGYGTALKPAWEPVVFARKPLSGTYAANCIEHGTGGLNIDGCRIQPRQIDDYGRSAANSRGTINAHDGFEGKSFKIKERDAEYASASGRFPSNLILSHHPGCEDNACHPDCPVTQLDQQSGISASRFFYQAKVSTAERNCGLPSGTVCDHPTLKPIDLCRYLATLVLPPPRTGHPRNLLIPFSGAGSEIIGATIAGWESITAIEKEENYIDQAWHRIKGKTGVKAILW